MNKGIQEGIPVKCWNIPVKESGSESMKKKTEEINETILDRISAGIPGGNPG